MLFTTSFHTRWFVRVGCLHPPTHDTRFFEPPCMSAILQANRAFARQSKLTRRTGQSSTLKDRSHGPSVNKPMRSQPGHPTWLPYGHLAKLQIPWSPGLNSALRAGSPFTASGAASWAESAPPLPTPPAVMEFVEAWSLVSLWLSLSGPLGALRGSAVVEAAAVPAQSTQTANLLEPLESGIASLRRSPYPSDDQPSRAQSERSTSKQQFSNPPS